MITAVLDTNVLASGLAGFLNNASIPGQILRSWRSELFVLTLSDHLLTELSRTLHHPYFANRLTAEQIAGALALFQSETLVTEITAEVHGVATHPEDDTTLATAISGSTNFLVTGDMKLQRLRTHRGVAIVSPREFLQILESQPPSGLP